MLRRILVTFLQRSIVLFLLVCLGCSAESADSNLSQRIEDQVRVHYKIPPEVKIAVGPLKPSSFPNYDAVTVTMDNGQKKEDYDFLLAKDNKTLLRVTKFDLTQDPYAEVMKKINLSGRPVRGNSDAKVTVVNFDDFECPFCSHMHQTLFPELLKEYGDRVKFVYKDFPLAEIHPWATHAAVDANCLAGQSSDAYWDYADYLHANQREISGEAGRSGQFAALDRLALAQGQTHKLDSSKLQACIKAQDDDAIKASVQQGEALGVEATPTMFINGQEVEGALSIAELRNVFDQALERAGVKPPPHPANDASAQAVSR
jgi:protein-disulfide isomerase